MMSFCAFLLVLTTGLAQTTSVTGKVTDDKGNPLAGASVVEKGTKNGVSADQNGSFSLNVKQGAKIFYRCDGGLYWKVFTDFAPRFVLNGVEGNSSRETSFGVDSKNTRPLIGLLSSNTFWWWYTLTSNLRHLNPYDVQTFPVAPDALKDKNIVKLADAYVEDMVCNSTMLLREQKKTGTTQTQSFKIQKSKPLIDEIDMREYDTRQRPTAD